MSVTLLIPSPLRQFTGGSHAISVSGGTVGAAVEAAITLHPKLRESLFASPGQIQPFVHMFVNGRDIREQGGLSAPVADGGEVLIIQAISGG